MRSLRLYYRLILITYTVEYSMGIVGGIRLLVSTQGGINLHTIIEFTVTSPFSKGLMIELLKIQNHQTSI